MFYVSFNHQVHFRLIVSAQWPCSGAGFWTCLSICLSVCLLTSCVLCPGNTHGHTQTSKTSNQQTHRQHTLFFFSPLIHTLTHTSQACFGVRHKGHLLANQSTFYTKCRARSHTTGMILQLCFEFDLRKMFKGKFSKALGAEGASYLKIWHKLGQRLNH